MMRSVPIIRGWIRFYGQMPATLVCCNLALAGRSYTIGTGGGGQSQQISKEIQAQLPSYEPVLQEPVSLTHKRGTMCLKQYIALRLMAASAFVAAAIGSSLRQV